MSSPPFSPRLSRRMSRAASADGAGAGISRPPLPASAVAAWHSELGCTPTAWVDYIGGRSLPGVNGPAAPALDPGFFNGKIVAKTAQSPQQYWRGTGLAEIAAVGSLPWMFVVARSPDGAAALGCVAALGTAGSDLQSLQVVGGKQTCYFSPARASSSLTINIAVNRIKAWRDGVNVNIAVNATVNSAASTATIGASCTAFAVGSDASGTGGNAGNWNVAYALICSSKPSAAEEAALDAWAQGYFGSA